MKAKLSEVSLQIYLIRYLKEVCPDECVFFHVPNGERRDKSTASKLKMMGVVAGIPDICLIHNGKTYFLELKTTTGKLSKNQEIVINKLKKAGVETRVVMNLEQVKGCLLEWNIISV